jgi:hypothetical protein
MKSMTTLLLSLAWIAFGCAGCATEKPPCDATTVAAMAAACAARVQTECVGKGIPREECTVIAECDKAADERQAQCGGAK